MLTKEEGGRHTPFFKGYRPQFYFRTTDVTGLIELPAGTEMVMPGDNIKMNGGADQPDRDGGRPALRHPRRRQDRRRRCRVQDPEVDINRPVAQLAERRSPKPQVGGSIPSWPASRIDCERQTESTNRPGRGRRRQGRALVVAIALRGRRRGRLLCARHAARLAALGRGGGWARRLAVAVFALSPLGPAVLAVHPRGARRAAQGRVADPPGDAADDRGGVRIRRRRRRCSSGCWTCCWPGRRGF